MPVRGMLPCFRAAPLLWVGCFGGMTRYNPPPEEGPQREVVPPTTPVPKSDTGTDSADTSDTGAALVELEDATACYLGPDRDGGQCLDALVLESLSDDYDYPAPYQGSPQYAEPVRFLDLEAWSGDLKLAPNFALSEVTRPANGRYGVVQTHAIGRLQDLRDELGALIINSGYRTPAHNEAVGGVVYSRHQYGDAFDIDPVSASLTELADACEREAAGFVGVYETHIHCDWRDDPLDPAFYDATRSVVWTPQPALEAWLVRDGGVLTAPAQGWDEGEPLREWRALDVHGNVIDRATGRVYAPPEGTAEVEVTVGRAVTRRMPL